MQQAVPEVYEGKVDTDHLVRDHGVNPTLVRRGQTAGRAQQRHLKLWLEMQHESDHAQRNVGHAHS